MSLPGITIPTSSVAAMFPPVHDTRQSPPGVEIDRDVFDAMHHQGYPAELPAGRPGWAVIIAGGTHWCTWIEGPA